MANFYGATSLIGGGTGALDSIDGAVLADLDGALVITDDKTYSYWLDDDNAGTESSPLIIAADANGGNKRWVLNELVCAGAEIIKDATNAVLTISCYHDTEATTPLIVLRKADGSLAAPALVDDNAVLGTIHFDGYDGSGWHTGAKIEARIDGTPSDATDMPTELTFWTCPDASATLVQRMTILANGYVGIGEPSPNAPLEVKGAKPGVVGGFQSGQLQVTGSGSTQYSCSVITGHNSFNGNTQLWYLGSTSDDTHDDIAFINRKNAPIHFYTNNTSRMIIDAAGLVGINTAIPGSQLEIAKDAANVTLTISCYHDIEATTPLITLRKADNTEASPALVDDNAVLGTIHFDGHDGSGWHTGAKIEARIDGTPSDGTDIPTELTFWVCSDGSATLIERMGIDPDGTVKMTGIVDNPAYLDVACANLNDANALSGIRLYEQANLRCRLYIDGQDNSFRIDTTNITNHIILYDNGVLDLAGTLAIDGVQLLTNRVIDVRCDDAINTGDVTSDGVIDALRDAMITHGLIAAA